MKKKHDQAINIEKKTNMINIVLEREFSQNTDGFAFSQEEGATVSQTDVIRAYNTNIPKPGGM